MHRYLESPRISAGFQILPHLCTLKVDCQLNWKPHPNSLPFFPNKVESCLRWQRQIRHTLPCNRGEEALVNLLEEKGQRRKTVGGPEIGKTQKWRGLKLKTFDSPTPGWMNHPMGGGGGKTVACKEEGKLSSPNLRKQTLTCKLMLAV